ncbi:hypothetical protein AB0J01_37810 [Streptomyces sp. NPDC050204]|uniref:hypothetical protein n=1 Tax=Streptomyces sp. NPDC050204 TaxID=3155514 RepID=UPI00343E0653
MNHAPGRPPCCLAIKYAAQAAEPDVADGEEDVTVTHCCPASPGRGRRPPIPADLHIWHPAPTDTPEATRRTPLRNSTQPGAT